MILLTQTFIGAYVECDGVLGYASYAHDIPIYI